MGLGYSHPATRRRDGKRVGVNWLARERGEQGKGGRPLKEEGEKDGGKLESACRRVWLLSCFEESTTGSGQTGRDSARDHCIHVQTQTDVE